MDSKLENTIKSVPLQDVDDMTDPLYEEKHAGAYHSDNDREDTIKVVIG